MRKGKRITACLLSLLMASTVLGVFAGCGGDGGADSEGFTDAVDAPAPSLAVEGAYSVGEEDPIIMVTMENGDFREGIAKEDVTLAGAFEQLNVLNVKTHEDVLSISTQGTVVESFSLQGMVTLENAFGTGDAATASADVKSVITYIDHDSYKYVEENGAEGVSKRLEFKVVTADPFTSRASDASLWKLKKLRETPITVEEDEIVEIFEDDTSRKFVVESVSEAKDEAVVSVELKEGTAEEIDELNGMPLIVDGAAFASGEEEQLTVSPEIASVDFYVEAIDFNNADEYFYRAHVSTAGEFVGGLTEEKIVLGADEALAPETAADGEGDAAEIENMGIEIVSFGQCDGDEDGGYDLVLKKTVEPAAPVPTAEGSDDGLSLDPLDPRDLHITVTLKEGTVRIPCGAVNSEPVSADIFYEPEEGTEETPVLLAANSGDPINPEWGGYGGATNIEYYADRVKELLSALYDFSGATEKIIEGFSKEPPVANPFAFAQMGFAMANFAITVLEMCGVFPRGASLNDVYYATMQTQTMIRELSAQMQDMYDHMDERLDASERRQQKIIYASAQNNWNGFLNGIYATMREKIDAFQSAYNSLLLKEFLNNKGDFTLEIKYERLWDEEKKEYISQPTVEGDVEGYGLMGGQIVGSRAVTLTGGLPNMVARLARAGSMYADFEQDFQAEFVRSFCDVTLDGVTPTKAQPYLDRAMTVEGDVVPFSEFYEAMRLYFFKKAVGTVGAASFMSTYNAYCNAVAGNGGNSPLDYLTTMMGVYYNFYPEAKARISTYFFDITQLSAQAGALACFMQQLSGLTAGGNKATLKQSAKLVAAELNRQKYNYEFKAQESIYTTTEESAKKTHEKIYSFVTQSFIQTAERKVVLLTNWDGQDGNRTKQSYGYYQKDAVGSDDDTLGQGVTAKSMSESRVSLDNVRAMAGRMGVSAKKIVTGEGASKKEEIKTYSSFTEYLYDFAGIVPGGKECTKPILCGYPNFISTTTQNLLTCFGLATNRGRWFFQEWKEYPVNRTAKWERHEYSAGCFRTHTVLQGDLFENNYASSNVTLLELATYCEMYWTWKHVEIGTFAGGKWDMEAVKAGNQDAAGFAWLKYSKYNYRIRTYVTMDCQVILQSAKGDYTPQKST